MLEEKIKLIITKYIFDCKSCIGSNRRDIVEHVGNVNNFYPKGCRYFGLLSHALDPIKESLVLLLENVVLLGCN